MRHSTWNKTRLQLGASIRRVPGHYLERRSEGLSLRNIAKELGISPVTLGTWTANSKPQSTFRPVQVVGAAPDLASATLRVVTPAGLQIEGLSFEQVVEPSRAWQ